MFGAALLLTPLVAFLHELGHYVSFRVFSFPGVRLHASSVSYADADVFWRLIAQGRTGEASLLHLPWQMAAATAAGPAVTYLIIAASVLLNRRPNTAFLSRPLGFVACCRSIALLPNLFLSLAEAPLPIVLRSDEAKLATLAHINPSLLIGTSILVGASLASLLLRTSRARWHTGLTLLLGWTAGTWLLARVAP